MKYNIMKLLIFVLCMYMLVISLSYKETGFSFSAQFPTTNITYYSSSPSSPNSIKCGTFYIDTAISPGTRLIGESMEFATKNLNQVIKKLSCNIVAKEYLPEQKLIIYYALTKKIPTTTDYKGKKINLQIAVYDEKSIIGWPMILGSF